MKPNCLLIPILITILLNPAPAGCRASEAPDKSWMESAQACGLDPTSMSLLEKNRFVITPKVYQQIFSVYLSGRTPQFITSDSILSAYHVLWEESVLRLENSMAARLPAILTYLVDQLKESEPSVQGNPALASSAKRRALLVLGVALRLLNDSFRLNVHEMDEILAKESSLIGQAEGQRLPEWLGPADNSLIALDYSRYKPRGFYTRSENLQRYFRAVAWLQSIPFRVNRDEEFLAILMMGQCLGGHGVDGYEKKWESQSFLQGFRYIIGANDNWDLLDALHQFGHIRHLSFEEDTLQGLRTGLFDSIEYYAEPSLINDQIRIPPTIPQEADEPEFRVLSPLRTASAILFHRTTDRQKYLRAYPSGLEVAILLGSSFAEAKLQDPQKAELLEAIDSCRAYLRGNSLYLFYLYALQALLDDPEPDAPDFMKSEAWQAKSCNTALAGWAQISHTWVLQSKQVRSYGCEFQVPTGFVEPEPEFYSRMAQLGDFSRIFLEQGDAFATDYEGIIASLERLTTQLIGVRDKESFRQLVSNLSLVDPMANIMAVRLIDQCALDTPEGAEAYFSKQRQRLGTLLADMKSGKSIEDPEFRELIAFRHFDLAELWHHFSTVCRRLEVISHKQLRQISLSESENSFIKDYASSLAGIMFYGGNSFISPRDDAPRVADVFTDGENHEYLHVGIARPQQIYVLYPWKGSIILCEGAISPYYEFVSHSRLTDETWRAILDTDQRPGLPEWMAFIVSERP